MEKYGYTKNDMYPVGKTRADILFKLGVPIYLLFSDNIAERVEKDVSIHIFKGLLGVKKDEWKDFLLTDAGATFCYIWEDVSRFAQHIRVDKEMQYGYFTDEYYEALYWEESSCLENYADERYELKGDLSDDLTDVLKNDTLYVLVIFEYADKLEEMFKESKIEELNSTDFIIALINKVCENAYPKET